MLGAALRERAGDARRFFLRAQRSGWCARASAARGARRAGSRCRGAQLQLLRGEALVVVAGRGVDGVVVGRVGLDDDAAGALAAAGAAGDLGEELERALAGAEVGQVQADVGVDDADDGDTGHVEALREHLRADEDVGLAREEGREDAVVRAARAGDVAVPAQEPRLREDARGLRLDLLDAGAERA